MSLLKSIGAYANIQMGTITTKQLPLSAHEAQPTRHEVWGDLKPLTPVGENAYLPSLWKEIKKDYNASPVGLRIVAGLMVILGVAAGVYKVHKRGVLFPKLRKNGKKPIPNEKVLKEFPGFTIKDVKRDIIQTVKEYKDKDMTASKDYLSMEILAKRLGMAYLALGYNEWAVVYFQQATYNNEMHAVLSNGPFHPGVYRTLIHKAMLVDVEPFRPMAAEWAAQNGMELETAMDILVYARYLESTVTNITVAMEDAIWRWQDHFRTIIDQMSSWEVALNDQIIDYARGHYDGGMQMEFLRIKLNDYLYKNGSIHSEEANQIYDEIIRLAKGPGPDRTGDFIALYNASHSAKRMNHIDDGAELYRMALDIVSNEKEWEQLKTMNVLDDHQKSMKDIQKELLKAFMIFGGSSHSEVTNALKRYLTRSVGAINTKEQADDLLKRNSLLIDVNTDPDVFYLLGQIFEGVKDHQRAIEYYTLALAQGTGKERKKEIKIARGNQLLITEDGTKVGNVHMALADFLSADHEQGIFHTILKMVKDRFSYVPYHLMEMALPRHFEELKFNLINAFRTGSLKEFTESSLEMFRDSLVEVQKALLLGYDTGKNSDNKEQLEFMMRRDIDFVQEKRPEQMDAWLVRCAADGGEEAGRRLFKLAKDRDPTLTPEGFVRALSGRDTQKLKVLGLEKIIDDPVRNELAQAMDTRFFKSFKLTRERDSIRKK